MAVFPKASQLCPYADRLAAMKDGDMCRVCSRAVYDLTGMDDAGRAAFMDACPPEGVCVSYRLPTAAAAAFAAAAMLGTPLAAVAADPATVPPPPASQPQTADDPAEIVGVMSRGPAESPFETITFPIGMFGEHRPSFPKRQKVKPAPKPEPAKTEPKS